MSIIGSKSAKLGVVLSYSGTNKGRLYKVRFDDGSESEHKAKNLQVEASKVNTSWDLTGVIGSGLVTTSTATVERAIVVGGNPYLLTGDGRGKFKAAPWRTGGGMDALSFKQSELLSDIKSGSSPRASSGQSWHLVLLGRPRAVRRALTYNGLSVLTVTIATIATTATTTAWKAKVTVPRPVIVGGGKGLRVGVLGWGREAAGTRVT